MKPKIGREIALLSLPVLLFGGAALLRSLNGRVLLPSFFSSNPFDPGPMRVEFSPFKTVDVKPFDIADGVEWAAETSVQIRGKWDMPPGWRMWAGGGFPSDVIVVYRRGNQWKTVPRQRGNRSTIGMNLHADTNVLSLKVDLDDVPRDAEEVRLRGRFDNQLHYSGAIPPGWKAPANLKIVGLNRILTVQTKPFDVKIKGQGELLPAPQVPHEPKIKLVEAKWFTEKYSNGNKERFFLHLRHTGPRGWNRHGARVRKVKVFDAGGRQVKLFDKDGTGKNPFYEYAGSFNQSLFSPNKPDSDRIEAMFSDDTAPRGGWSGVKQPIRIEMEISDNECWPLEARVTLRHESDFDQKTLGTK